MDHYYTDNSKLKSEPKTIRFVFSCHDFEFHTDNGVFSKNAVDYGTQALLKSIVVTGTRILDVGCGYGPIGIVLGTLFPLHRIDMVDINDRAIEYANLNIKQNRVEHAKAFYSNMFEEIKDTYSMIITNPPIRAGKHIVHAIITDAIHYLDTGGELWLVIQKKQGAPSAEAKMKEVYGNVSIVKRDKGYYILKSVKQ